MHGILLGWPGQLLGGPNGGVQTDAEQPVVEAEVAEEPVGQPG